MMHFSAGCKDHLMPVSPVNAASSTWMGLPGVQEKSRHESRHFPLNPDTSCRYVSHSTSLPYPLNIAHCYQTIQVSQRSTIRNAKHFSV